MSEHKTDYKYVVLELNHGVYIFRVLKESSSIKMTISNLSNEQIVESQVIMVLGQLVYSAMKNPEDSKLFPDGAKAEMFLDEKSPRYDSDYIESEYPVFLDQIPCSAFADFDS